jgi:hypothetical protein
MEQVAPGEREQAQAEQHDRQRGRHDLSALPEVDEAGGEPHRGGQRRQRPPAEEYEHAPGQPSPDHARDRSNAALRSR